PEAETAASAARFWSELPMSRATRETKNAAARNGTEGIGVSLVAARVCEKMQSVSSLLNTGNQPVSSSIPRPGLADPSIGKAYRAECACARRKPADGRGRSEPHSECRHSRARDTPCGGLTPWPRRLPRALRAALA